MLRQGVLTTHPQPVIVRFGGRVLNASLEYTRRDKTMIPLTLVEEKMLKALESALEYLTRKDVQKGEYLELMATIRDAAKAGENKKYGCWSGAHGYPCNCTPDKQGQSTHYLKYFKRKAK